MKKGKITCVASGDNIRVIGLSSSKALIIWVNGTALKWSLVTDSGGFGTVNTLAATAHADDWGAVRSGGYVYVPHTDNASDSTGNYVLVGDLAVDVTKVVAVKEPAAS